jgi:hypothetical protein
MLTIAINIRIRKNMISIETISLEIESQYGGDFPHPFRLPLRLTQPLTQWVLGYSQG